MQNYFRSLLRIMGQMSLVIFTWLVLYLGILGLACHQNDAWNCTILDLASMGELHAIVITLLAAPFWIASFDIADANASLVAKVMWPVLGFIFSAVAYSSMLAAYFVIMYVTS